MGKRFMRLPPRCTTRHAGCWNIIVLRELVTMIGVGGYMYGSRQQDRRNGRFSHEFRRFIDGRDWAGAGREVRGEADAAQCEEYRGAWPAGGCGGKAER